MSHEPLKELGNYKILGEIGRGGMATVYKAVQTSLNRTVAIKVLPRKHLTDPEEVERFEREAKAVAMLNHPNVVQIIDKELSDELFYFVMEYVDGASLEQILKQRRLSVQQALGVFKAVCKGLQYAHGKGIIHRDLNPRNILVSRDLSVIKVADFGVCRIESISRSMGTLPTMQASTAKFHYLAPEQAADPSTADHRGDIYSLGVLFYEMLTGRVPNGRISLPSQVNSEVPPQIDSIVLKCLEADVKNRYQSVNQLLRAVKDVEEALHYRLDSELRGIGRSTSSILTRPFRGGWWIIALAVLLLAAVAIGMVVFRDRLPSLAQLFPSTESPEAAPSQPQASQPKEEPAQTASPAATPGSSGQAAPEPPERSAAPDSGPAASSQSGPAESSAAEAQFMLAQAKVRQGGSESEEEAARIFGDIAAFHPDTRWAPQALAQEAALEADSKARQLEPGMGVVPKALLTYRTLVDRYPQHPEAEKAFWELADYYLDLRRYEEAAQCYWDLGTHFPDTDYDAWWEAAQLYDKRVKDKERARQAYLRVPTTSRRYDDAQKRAARLDR